MPEEFSKAINFSRIGHYEAVEYNIVGNFPHTDVMYSVLLIIFPLRIIC